MRAALLIALWLLAPGAAGKDKLEKETLELVELFLRVPTAELPPEAVPEFLVVEPAKLPKKLRQRFEAKRLELLALKKVADGRYKSSVRFSGGATAGGCEAPKELDSIALLLQTGFTELSQDESDRLLRDTSCSECELRTEFSLTLILTPPKKKGGKKTLHYLMHQGDPLMSLVGGYRAGVERQGGTSFFGVGGTPKCH